MCVFFFVLVCCCCCGVDFFGLFDKNPIRVRIIKNEIIIKSDDDESSLFFSKKKTLKRKKERDFEKKGKKNWSTSSLAKNVRSSLISLRQKVVRFSFY